MKTGLLKYAIFFMILSGAFSSCAEDEYAMEETKSDAATRAAVDSETPYFYYYDGKKEYFQLDTKYAFISLSEEKDAEIFASNNIEHQPLRMDITEGRRDKTRHKRFWTVLSFEKEIPEEEYWAKLSEIKSWGKNILVAPYFRNHYQDKIGLSNFLYVKLKEQSDVELLRQTVEEEGATIVYQNEFMPLWYIVSVTENSKFNAMELANYLYESGLFQYAEPDLLVEDKVNYANDPYYVHQWNLANTGQYGGMSGTDIKAGQAWSMSTGSNVTVAVVDEGIDLGHPDLEANIHSLSYDSESRTSPQKILGVHGTAVAGIIGARRNNMVGGSYVGIAGIAPNVKLMSVSNSLGGTTLSREARANGINWARQNGADVISNSWSTSIPYQIINEAIANAVRLGRGGKGCVVVFSSGNNYSSSVSYPSLLREVISVGSIDRFGYRAIYSNYGTELDIVAPGVSIYTTDIRGASGYNSEDYVPGFGGTSAAAPHVSAVAALILSANSSLTYQEVRYIIERTANKQQIQPVYTFNTNKANGTWNNEVGYGLLDAYAAVSLATAAPSSPTTLSISGQSPLTANSNGYAGTTLTVSPVNPNYTYFWSASFYGQCDRWYIWPNGRSADVSVYLNPWQTGGGGTVAVTCKVYNNTTYVGTTNYYVAVGY